MNESRAAHLAALKSELEMVNRHPKPNTARAKQIEEQIDLYSDEPKQRRREAPGGSTPPADAPPADAAASPRRRSPRKSAAAKKAAAKVDDKA